MLSAEGKRELEDLIGSVSITDKSHSSMEELFPGITMGEYKFLLAGIVSGLYMREYAESHHGRSTTRTTDEILRITEKGISELVEKGAREKEEASNHILVSTAVTPQTDQSQKHNAKETPPMYDTEEFLALWHKLTIEVEKRIKKENTGRTDGKG